MRHFWPVRFLRPTGLNFNNPEVALEFRNPPKKIQILASKHVFGGLRLKKVSLFNRLKNGQKSVAGQNPRFPERAKDRNPRIRQYLDETTALISQDSR